MGLCGTPGVRVRITKWDGRGRSGVYIDGKVYIIIPIVLNLFLIHTYVSLSYVCNRDYGC